MVHFSVGMPLPHVQLIQPKEKPGRFRAFQIIRRDRSHAVELDVHGVAARHGHRGIERRAKGE